MTNLAAQQRQIFTDTPVSDLLGNNKDAFEAFTQGKLCLSLSIEGISCPATVIAINKEYLFCLDAECEMPELQAYALAAQILRGPLSSAMTGIDQIIATADTPAVAEQAAKINRNLHQLLRAVGNMSDAVQYAEDKSCRLQSQNIMWVLDEILQKAAPLTQQAGHPLEYALPNYSLMCKMDREKLERAILNMISNALKYSAPGTSIRFTLYCTDTRVNLTVENDLPECAVPMHNLFSRYLRQPGIEDAYNGIGLGLSIVKNVAAIHGGTVLMEQPDDKMRITMSFPLDSTSSTVLRSPVSLPVHYAGGYNSELVELSDCLPYQLYDGKH